MPRAPPTSRLATSSDPSASNLPVPAQSRIKVSKAAQQRTKYAVHTIAKLKGLARWSAAESPAEEDDEVAEEVAQAVPSIREQAGTVEEVPSEAFCNGESDVARQAPQDDPGAPVRGPAECGCQSSGLFAVARVGVRVRREGRM